MDLCRNYLGARCTSPAQIGDKVMSLEFRAECNRLDRGLSDGGVFCCRRVNPASFLGTDAAQASKECSASSWRPKDTMPRVSEAFDDIGCIARSLQWLADNPRQMVPGGCAA